MTTSGPAEGMTDTPMTDTPIPSPRPEAEHSVQATEPTSAPATDAQPDEQTDALSAPAAAVTVVIPTRDRDQLLARAIAGIAAQDHPGAVEVLVVRDGTPVTDVPVDLPPRMTLRQIPNTRSPGLAGTRNTGICAAAHDLVAFCDDDDEWLPGKLSAQVPLLQRDPAASVVATGICVVHDGVERDRPGPLQPVHLEDLLLRRIMELHPSSFLLRKADLLGPIGLVDETLPGGYAEDYDLLLRAATVGPVVSVPRPLTRIHWHGSSFYFSRWQTIHSSLDALLVKHPQFAQVPRGRARIRGQQAVALAAMGRRREALSTALETVRLSPGEPRGYIAAAAALRLLSIDRLQAWLHRRGRGL
jgi:GT2 family glycosyltransferase